MWHISSSLTKETGMFSLNDHMPILEIFPHLALLCKGLVLQVTPERMHLKT